MVVSTIDVPEGICSPNYQEQSSGCLGGYLVSPMKRVCLLLLLSVLLFGVEVKGATSWFRIGGFTFQPSEIAKVTTNLALASYLGAYSTNLKNIQHQLGFHLELQNLLQHQHNVYRVE